MNDVSSKGGLTAADFAFEDDKTVIAAAGAGVTEGADAAANVGTAYDISVGDVFEGRLDPVGDHDWVEIALVRGQAVRIDLEGFGEDYLSDPFLRIRDAAGALIERNDDNLNTRDSHLVYTPDAAGAYYIDIGSFENRYSGDYRLTVSAIDETRDAPGNAATPFLLGPGESFTGREVGATEPDWIGLSVEKGVTYSVKIRMIAADGDAAREFSQSLKRADGSTAVEALGDEVDGDDSYFVFTAKRTETLYAEVRIAGTGEGYEVEFETYDPLSAITWRDADPAYSEPIRVYLYDAGETLDLETTTYRARDFTAAGEAAVRKVLDQIEHVVDVDFTFTNDLSQSDFRLAVGNPGSDSLGFMIPQGGGQEVEGAAVFNGAAQFWNATTLRPGGLMYSTIVHEIGHGLGLAHPHDDGGNSLLMQGVKESDDFGRFRLSQDMFTVMSYNTSSFELGRNFRNDFGAGYMSTLAPFDIAALQRLYGATEAVTGDTVYRLTRNAAPEAIWDTGGADRIVVASPLDAVVDLRPATLRQEDGGGGSLSYVGDGYGAKTIASGVVIETAIGGAGDDRITGNAAANRLIGKAGEDVIRGGTGDDTAAGGAQSDRLFGGGGDDELRGGGWSDRIAGGGGADLLTGGRGADEASGGRGADTLVGGAGRDDLSGDRGRDVLAGGADDDRLSGKAGDDRLVGGAGGDWLQGGAGDDFLNGGARRDRLVGGAGDDTLAGGGGPDLFVFFAANQGADIVIDFQDGNDRLELRGIADFDLLAIAERGGDALIRFDGGSIRLDGVDPDDIDAGDFIF